MWEKARINEGWNVLQARPVQQQHLLPLLLPASSLLLCVSVSLLIAALLQFADQYQPGSPLPGCHTHTHTNLCSDMLPSACFCFLVCLCFFHQTTSTLPFFLPLCKLRELLAVSSSTREIYFSLSLSLSPLSSTRQRQPCQFRAI